jgi:hypothetical protein
VVGGVHRRPHFSPSKENAEFWPAARSGEDQSAAGDLPPPVGRPQCIPSCTDVDILLGLGSTPVDDEVAVDLEFEFCVAWLDAALAYPPRPVEVFDMLASCTSGLKMMIEFMGRGLPRGDGFVIYSLAIERCRNRSGEAPRLGDRTAVELLEPIFPGNGNQ